MRIPPESLINPMSLFWYLVYAAALFLIFVTGILAGSRDPKKAPAKKQSEAANQKPLWIQPSTTGRSHLTVQTSHRGGCQSTE
jgi:hypothetical protein